MELVLLLVLLVVIGLALCWPRSERERAEQERARAEWARDHPPVEPQEGSPSSERHPDT